VDRGRAQRLVRSAERRGEQAWLARLIFRADTGPGASTTRNDASGGLRAPSGPGGSCRGNPVTGVSSGLGRHRHDV
jgi:hypothetical protein